MHFKTALLATALCALALLHAEARTLYVDASRPNNKGNGLKAKTAKKTIQAAINIAKKGDTILVYPGTYAPIKTQNLGISIKGVKGMAQTTIHKKKLSRFPLLDLGSGQATKVSGLSFSSASNTLATKGGNVQNCTFTGCGKGYGEDAPSSFENTKLTACVLDGCYGSTFGVFANKSVFNRCAIQSSPAEKGNKLTSCSFFNTLFCAVTKPVFTSCTLVNCTVAGNKGVGLSTTKAYNTIFYKVAAAQFKKSRKNTLKNCYKGTAPKFVDGTTKKVWVAGDGWDEKLVGGTVNWEDPDTSESGSVKVSGTTTDEILAAAKAQVGKPNAYYGIDEEFYEYGSYHSVPSDYRLAKGSPCINKGKLTKAQKKLVGSKDLAGKKRIKGKVDIGCYEFQ